MKANSHRLFKACCDTEFWVDLVMSVESFQRDSQAESFLYAFSVKPNYTKTYLISQSVSDMSDMVKVKRGTNDRYDWSVFESVESGKYRFIMPDGSMFFMTINKVGSDRLIYILWIRDDGVKTYFDFFYVMNGNQVSHDVENLVDIENKFFRLMCFIFLSDIEERVIKPKEKTGTKKSGKFINDSFSDIILVTPSWNITSVRSESFQVRGHFALRRIGPGRSSVRVVFISPFTKNGYVRKSKKQQYE